MMASTVPDWSHHKTPRHPVHMLKGTRVFSQLNHLLVSASVWSPSEIGPTHRSDNKTKDGK